MEFITVSGAKYVAANTSAKAYITPPVGSTWKLKSFSYVPQADSATNGTDYASIRPYKDTASPTALAAARDTAATSLTTGSAESFTLTATGRDLEITSTDPFYLLVDATPGAGVAVDIAYTAEFEVLRT